MLMKEKYIKNKNLDFWLDFITENLGGLSNAEFWPLGPTQMLPYFEEDLLIDFYKRLNFLQKKGLSKKEIFTFFPNTGILRYFLTNICTGFKSAEKIGLLHTTYKEREDFCQYILDLIFMEEPGYMEKGKPRLFLDKRQVEAVLKNQGIKIDDENRKITNSFRVALFGINWAWHFDLFAPLGSRGHGPYEIRFLGDKYSMSVFEYYNQKPKESWLLGIKSPVDRVTFYLLMPPSEDGRVIHSRGKTNESVGKLLKYVFIEIDGKFVNDLKKIEKLTREINALTLKQHQYVDKLTPLQIADRAVFMNYFAFKEFFGKDWKKLYEKTSKNIKKIGNKYIKNPSKTPDQLSRIQIRKRFDPRNDYLL